MSDLVFTKNDRVWTNTLEISKGFDRPHDDVLKSVRSLLSVDEISHGSFAERTYENRGREYPCFDMDQTGASLLIMGFNNSRKAIAFKRKLLREFQEAVEEVQRLRINQLSIANQISEKLSKSVVSLQDRLDKIEARVEMDALPSSGPSRVSSKELWKRWRSVMRLSRYKHPRLHGAITAMMIAGGVKPSRDWSLRPVRLFDEEEADKWFEGHGRAKIRGFIARMAAKEDLRSSGQADMFNLDRERAKRK